MDNFNYKKFVYDGSLLKDNDTKQTLNENAPGYDTRKFGESLPTLESVKAAYEAKEEKTINEGALGALFGAFTLFYLWKKGELKFGGAKIEDVEEYSDLPDELQQKVSNDEFEKIKNNTDLI
tara:strand:- start:1 stop:366 length:366 start_codon:yes stop_codon:yes gene_type:complete